MIRIHLLLGIVIAAVALCTGCGGGTGSANSIVTGSSSSGSGGGGNGGLGGGGTPVSSQTVTVSVTVPGISRQVASLRIRARSIADVVSFTLKVTDQSGASLATTSTPYRFPQTAPITMSCKLVAGARRLFTVSGLNQTGGVEFSGAATADVVSGMPPVVVAVQSAGATVTTGGAVIDPNAPVAIVYDSVPPYGTWGVPLLGHVVNVLPAQCKTVTFIEVFGGWWVKPYWDSEFTSVNSDATFSVNITTGGYDQDATTIKTWLVTLDYPVPANPPPDPAPGNGVLAVVSTTRSP